jgi:hypothetical protein
MYLLGIKNKLIDKNDIKSDVTNNGIFTLSLKMILIVFMKI